MAFTESNMLPLGTAAPDFNLPDTVTDTMKTLADVRGKNATVVMFLCNHCPYVLHLNAGIVSVAADYTPQGVGFVGISANDAEAYPQDAPELMKIHAAEVGYTFPYLYDATQAVAKAYDAACTPDFYIFDADLKLVYRGRFDAARPKNDTPVTGADLRAALDTILRGGTISAFQIPSGGCNIKWKS